MVLASVIGAGIEPWLAKWSWSKLLDLCATNNPSHVFFQDWKKTFFWKFFSTGQNQIYIIIRGLSFGLRQVSSDITQLRIWSLQVRISCASLWSRLKPRTASKGLRSSVLCQACAKVISVQLEAVIFASKCCSVTDTCILSLGYLCVQVIPFSWFHKHQKLKFLKAQFWYLTFLQLQF